MCSAPQKADKYRQICHPFPLFLPLSAAFPGLGFVVQARHFGNCSGTEQAGIFISHLHLHCFLSWRGAGGRRGRRWGFLCQPRRPGARPSSAGSLRSSSSLVFLEAGAFGTWERSAQLEVAISNYPPISPACKMCFCVGCLPARAPVCR